LTIRAAHFSCYIAFDKLGTENYWAHNATRNGIFVRRTLDGGRTWEKHAAAVIAQKTAPGIPFEDKPGIVADNTNSRFAGKRLRRVDRIHADEISDTFLSFDGWRSDLVKAERDQHA
jgi:hypothetical protein